MAETLDLNSEEFMTLLTDALRAGPASPEWSQAVKLLRSTDQNVDEYQLLCTARENLESGKEYRSVRAGVGFTRRLMESVEHETTPRGPSTAAIIAMLAGVVIVAVIIVIAVMLYKGPAAPGQKPGTEDLAAMIFGNRLAAASFVAKGAEAQPSSGWAKFGELPLAVSQGTLHPAIRATTTGSNYAAGGWVLSDAIPADQPIEIDATVQLAKPGDEGIAQVFVSDEPITDANATGGHALVWQIKGTESRAFLPDGKNASSGEKFGDQRDVSIRVRINRDTALIDASDRRMYAGPVGLATDKPRYVGVRFLRHGSDDWDRLAVRSLVVQKP